MFPTDIDSIFKRIDSIDPIKYAKTRNFIDGAVTKLSPYISRGVISTKQVLEAMLQKGYKVWQMEKFVQELAWRDYYQQVWIAKGNAIDADLKNKQPDVHHHTMPKAIVEANTGITAIDTAITEFYTTGYLHNHIRMYIASIVCNVGKYHWLVPAQWMYHHLIDADWASNALSWQWTAAAFSNKKYYANQENINKYCHTTDRGTMVDVAYDAFEDLPIPTILKEQSQSISETILPIASTIKIDHNLPTLIYNFYNLDYQWKKELDANRVLLLEPSFFKKYISSTTVINFMLALSQHIPNIQVYVGEFIELINTYNVKTIFYKEHPTNSHYKGIVESRDWLSSNVTGFFPSFFGYWKKLERELKKQVA